MKKFIFLTYGTLISILAFSQTKTKQQTLEFVSYSCDGLCYYSFKEIKSNKDFAYNDYDFDKINNGYKNCKEEIDSKCDDFLGNCTLKGQKYIITLQYKLLPIINEQYIETNIKAYKWVIVKMEKIVVKKNQNNDLSFLSMFDKKYPRDINLFNVTQLQSRLKVLLGNEYSLFIKNMDVQTPIEIRNNTQTISDKNLSENIFTAQGCKEHSCNSDESILCIDVKNNNIYVGILKDGKVKIYSEINTAIYPYELQNWSDRFGVQSTNNSFTVFYSNFNEKVPECRCSFGLDREDYENKNFVYTDNRYDEAFIKIGENILSLRFEETEDGQTITKVAVSKDYKVIIKLSKLYSVYFEDDGSYLYDGTIEITNIHTQDKIVRTIYGVCGCS